MAKVRFRVLTNLSYLILILVLSVLLGAFTGIKNAQDYQIKSLEFEELTADVKVYRDEYFIPTIIAENEPDLFFAQGYEYARDRLWQAELLRSVGAGDISRLFGKDLVNADVYLKTLQIREAAGQQWERLMQGALISEVDQQIVVAVNRWVQGFNKYIQIHSNNLPIEFILLGVKPKQWTHIDVMSIHGILSEDLSFSSLNREFMRRDMAIQFGPEKAEELFPIVNPEAKNYYFAQNYTDFSPISLFDNLNDQIEFMNIHSFSEDVGSNNWVVGPEKSKTNTPLIANDPHLGLTTPGIWWQVHLVVKGENEFHVEGFALPAPGIVIGHNEKVSWGMTNTSTDALDVYYFLESDDGSQYYHDGQWKDFENKTEVIEFSDGTSTSFDLRMTEFGPVLDDRGFSFPDDEYVYVMRWVLNEDLERDVVFRAIFGLLRAENAQDIHDTLEYFALPGQNIVYATVNGEWGYQYTGLIANRTVPGSGVIPQNGSDPRFDWNGVIPYDQHLWLRGDQGDIPDGYFVTANQKVDTRDVIYISDRHDVDYRADRIKQLLDQRDLIHLGYMQRIQGDTKNLYAKQMLTETIDTIKSMNFDSEIEDKAIKARDRLVEWTSGENAYKMDRDLIAPTIYIAFRVFFEELTFKDEFDQMGEDWYERYSGNTEQAMQHLLNDNDATWFDDINTNQEIETMNDITELAFDKAVRYLLDTYGKRIPSWEYGNINEVVFSHPIGERLKIFNEGNKGIDGSEFTVKAATSIPGYDGGKINFEVGWASSMRFIAELEPTWSNVKGITIPGEVGHLWNKHRSDSVNDWIENVLHDWNFSKERSGKPAFTYVKK